MEFRKLKGLIEKIKELDVNYTEARVIKDGQRFWGSIRPATNNDDRKKSVKFIRELATSIVSQKEFYSHTDSEYPGAGTGGKSTTRYLKEVIAGAILLELHKIIEGEYRGNEERAKASALVGSLLGVLNIKSWAEVSVADKKACWEAEKRYLDVIFNGKEVTWPKYNQTSDAIKHIDEALDSLPKTLELAS